MNSMSALDSEGEKIYEIIKTASLLSKSGVCISKIIELGVQFFPFFLSLIK